jgi:hypothetical protein
VSKFTTTAMTPPSACRQGRSRGGAAGATP